MSLPVLNEALAAYRAGYMPIPLRTDQGNRKRPAIPSWRQYQHQRPDEDTIREWFADGEANLGIITGKVSGLVVLDLDGRIADPRAWLAGHGFNVNTPIVATGGGGVHVEFAGQGLRQALRDVGPGVAPVGFPRALDSRMRRRRRRPVPPRSPA